MDFLLYNMYGANPKKINKMYKISIYELIKFKAFHEYKSFLSDEYSKRKNLLNA